MSSRRDFLPSKDPRERNWRKRPARHRRQSCTSKRVYASEHEARVKANELNAGPDAWHVQEHYRCRYCTGWHVGRSAGYPIDRDRLHEIVTVEAFCALDERVL